MTANPSGNVVASLRNPYFTGIKSGRFGNRGIRLRAAGPGGHPSHLTTTAEITSDFIRFKNFPDRLLLSEINSIY
jgi:hypothetical protein